MISFKEFFELVVEGRYDTEEIKLPDFFLVRVPDDNSTTKKILIFDINPASRATKFPNFGDEYFVSEDLREKIITGSVKLQQDVDEDKDTSESITLLGFCRYNNNVRDTLGEQKDVSRQSVFIAVAGNGTNALTTLLHLFDRDHTGLGNNNIELSNKLSELTENKLVEIIKKLYDDKVRDGRNVKILCPLSQKPFNRNVIEKLIDADINEGSIIQISKQPISKLPVFANQIFDIKLVSQGLIYTDRLEVEEMLKREDFMTGVKSKMAEKMLGTDMDEIPFKLNWFRNAVASELDKLKIKKRSKEKVKENLYDVSNLSWNQFMPVDINNTGNLEFIFFDDNHNTAYTPIMVMRMLRSKGLVSDNAYIHTCFGVDRFMKPVPAKLFNNYLKNKSTTTTTSTTSTTSEEDKMGEIVKAALKTNEKWKYVKEQFPLFPVKSIIDLVKKDVNNPDKIKEYLNTVNFKLMVIKHALSNMNWKKDSEEDRLTKRLINDDNKINGIINNHINKPLNTLPGVIETYIREIATSNEIEATGGYRYGYSR